MGISSILNLDRSRPRDHCRDTHGKEFSRSLALMIGTGAIGGLLASGLIASVIRLIDKIC